MIDATLINDLKNAVRVKSSTANAEVQDLAEACILDLKLRGVHVTELDPLVKQAQKLYCKAHFGYDEKVDRFEKAYTALADSMALSGEYSEEE